MKITDELESSGDDILVTTSTYKTLPFLIGSNDLFATQPEVTFTGALPPDQTLLPTVTRPFYSHSVVIDQSPEVPDTSMPEAASALPDRASTGVQDIAAELDGTGVKSTAVLDEAEHGSGYISVQTTEPAEVTQAPTLKYVTTSSMTTAAKGKELVVFFSLRVTNMHFSDDLFNRSSQEYKALEQQFMQLVGDEQLEQHMQ